VRALARSYDDELVALQAELCHTLTESKWTTTLRRLAVVGYNPNRRDLFSRGPDGAVLYRMFLPGARRQQDKWRVIADGVAGPITAVGVWKLRSALCREQEKRTMKQGRAKTEIPNN
jgi:hypothetical protein